jgi:hypothetical protein
MGALQSIILSSIVSCNYAPLHTYSIMFWDTRWLHYFTVIFTSQKISLIHIGAQLRKSFSPPPKFIFEIPPIIPFAQNEL